MQQVLLAERSFVDRYDFAFNCSDNGSYRATYDGFWRQYGIRPINSKVRCWVAESWWYQGLSTLERYLAEPSEPKGALV
ncbi:hypothetical protein CHLRE_01g041700v5 [Chlamydomonas reinhardtii]|uniref:Uncharacterized protein n=1 Tax=Chlamydomonas reinhardtii TaxID=3055 RepID=A8HML6_CHLRE|nr:uncharacterized protein CHLRE_01g041700v5 [Chlamydomonas reinhardtii]PNW88725.1 hypothetical protein CHLRE_01g041700v5 [Chlamydomonas reinhardtii]|eukprot:XP_001690156.1 predicted protein [Chlamydomonas reinhardtii]